MDFALSSAADFVPAVIHESIRRNSMATRHSDTFAFQKRDHTSVVAARNRAVDLAIQRRFRASGYLFQDAFQRSSGQSQHEHDVGAILQSRVIRKAAVVLELLPGVYQALVARRDSSPGFDLLLKFRYCCFL